MKFKHIKSTGIYIGITAFLLGSCQQGPQNSEQTSQENMVVEHVDTGLEQGTGEENFAVFTALADSFNFGSIKEGEKVSHNYEFVNEGNAPLIIRQVSASCGCTTPEYSKKPIAPGETGNIKVVFDSDGQYGQHHKVITVMTNAKEAIALLHLRGDVTK